MSSGSNQTNASLPVAVDVMGADNGPGVIIEGALQAVDEFDISVLLVGDEEVIRKRLQHRGRTPSAKIQVCHASQVITMEDSPTRAVRRKPDASVCVAFNKVKAGEATAVVSPGNTGAMMAAGLFICGTVPGITRPAIASLIPNVDSLPTVLLDSGANTDSSASQLVQFAIMGHFYAVAVLGLEAPRVALLSNGTESSKGNDRIRAAALILKSLPVLKYTGFVEGRDIAADKADVVVCDGFVGNVVLKTMEGAVELALSCMKQYVERSVRSKLGMWLAKPMFKTLFREKLDKSAYGGAPLLGLNNIGIVCHGSSDERAIKNAIRVADMLHRGETISGMSQALVALEESADFENGMWNRLDSHFHGGKSSSDKGAGEQKEKKEKRERKTKKDKKVAKDGSAVKAAESATTADSGVSTIKDKAAPEAAEG